MSQIEKTLTIDAPEPASLDQQVTIVGQMVDVLEIDCPEMYQFASDQCVELKKQRDAFEAKRKELVDPLNKVVKSINDLFRGPTARVDSLLTATKGKMTAYNTEQRRIADEARRKAEQEAEAERKRLREEAEAAMEQGDVEAAMELTTTAEVITAAPAVVEVPKATGSNTTVKWSAELTDKAAFLRFALEDPEGPYFEMIEVNMKPLNQMAVAQKAKLKIPGVTAKSTESIAVRSR